MITLERDVERGVAWLDAHAPADWFDRIDLDRLDILSCQDCVLGQVFEAAAQEDPDSEHGYGWAASKYGFSPLANRGFAGSVYTKLWREKILALREERASAELPTVEREEELVCV